MKLAKPLLATALLAAGWLMPDISHAASCSGTVGHVKMVSLDSARTTTVNYVYNPDGPPPGPGRFDPAPLLETTVTASGLKTAMSCVVVHFSSESYIFDNGIVFQVLLDGVPMKGNAPSGPDSIPQPSVNQGNPIIYNNDSVEVGRPHGLVQMLSYTFFAKVPGGDHDIQVLFANCCSNDLPAGATGDIVEAATLTVESK